MSGSIRLTRRRNLLDDAARHPNAASYVVPMAAGFVVMAIALVALYGWLTITALTAPDLTGAQGLAWRITLVVIGTAITAVIVQLLAAQKVILEDETLVVIRAFITYVVPWGDVKSAEWVHGMRTSYLAVSLTRPRRGSAADPTHVAWFGGNFAAFRTKNRRARTDQLAQLVNARRAANVDRFAPAQESRVTTHVSRPATITYCASAIAAAVFLATALTR